MFTALKAFVSDLLSTIVFLIVFASTNDAPLAVGVSIAVGVLQVAVENKFRCGQARLELIGPAGPDDGRGDGGVRQHPGDRQGD